MTWHPRVTVAAVIEHDGRFLLVEERTPQGLRLNQPAGHWEPGESLLEAAIRETREETGFTFRPAALVSVYHWSAAGDVWLRFVFSGEASAPPDGPELDPDIVRTLWMTHAEIVASRERHRGPQVLRCLEDWLAGRRAPLDLLVELG